MIGPQARGERAQASRWRPRPRHAFSAMAVAIALLAALLPRPVLALDAALTLSPSVGPPTTLTVATGSGFAPSERVVLGFDKRRLETLRAAPDGTFSEEVKVPATASPGGHTVSAKGAASGKATAAFTVQTDWPTARFVPEGTGFNPYENVLSPSNVGDLEVAWSAETEGFLFSTPVVVDGVVYVTGHVGVTGDAKIYAYDAATGDPLWSTEGSGQPPSDLAVAGGRLYLGFLQGHVLRAYDATTGDLLWDFAGPNRAPTVVDGVVYAADNIRSLWAIDARTGRRMWVAHAPLGGYGRGVAVGDGAVHVGGDEVDGNSPVYAYDAANGDLVWRTNTRGGIWGTLALADGTVYAGSTDDLLYALDARSGRIRWTGLTGAGISSSPAVAEGVVYVGSEDGNVYAFDAQTGKELWVAPTGGPLTTGQAAAVANGVVYIGSTDHNVYAFDAATGEQRWSYETGSNAQKQSVVDGTLYSTSFDTNLYAFRLPG